MASSSESSSRANIRIEIKNDFSEEMDVEDAEEFNILSDAEVEDGEISDSKSNDNLHNSQTRQLFANKNIGSNKVENQWPNNEGSSTTGVDTFTQDEQEKLYSRAQRFGLNPDDCKNITDQQLQELRDSLGITEDEEINIRFEAIHLYGTQEMSTQDVFGYFGKYGPSSIEWINDESCNVLWLDKISAARAFHGLSNPVDGMPVTGTCDPFQSDPEKEKENDEAKGRSILLKSREVTLADDAIDVDKKIHVSEINIPIPPGYWRLGESHSKAKYILMRFAKRTDKKPLKAERFSEYYRKYGNPNFGGMKGLISKTRKNKMKGLIPEEKVSSGNPWGNLAKNWNNDIHERAAETYQVPYQPKNVSKSILNRLGSNKRNHKIESDDEEIEKKEIKKSKVPRMRMYADEEEARIEKIKQMKKIRVLEQIEEKMTQKTSDLRNRINKSVEPGFAVKIPLPEPAKLRPIRIEVSGRGAENDVSSENSEEEDLQVQQKSKVTVIVKKPTISKPTVASTIWSRLDIENRKQTPQRLKTTDEKNKSDSDSESKNSKSDSSESESDSDDEEYNSAVRHKFSKAINARPGFNRDLKSRLGLTTDHKSPLRIEINNDHYKKS